MCVGSLFSGPKMPQMGPSVVPQRQAAPTVKSAQQRPEYVEPEKIKDKVGDEEQIETRKKKALEIKKVKEGVKQFSAIDEKSMPQGPEGGVNVP
jgi:hypothetical protein